MNENHKNVLKLRRSGLKFSEIARITSRSASRVNQIYRYALRMERDSKEWWYGLNCSTLNCLCNAGFLDHLKSKEDLKELILSGKLSWPHLKGKYRNMGKKSFENLYAFVGVPFPNKQYCTLCGQAISHHSKVTG